MNALDYRGRTLVLTGAAGGIGQGLAQVRLRLQAIQCVSIHRRGIELVRMRPFLFGPVHGRVGIFEQFFRIIPMIRVHSTANSPADIQMMADHHPRLAQLVQNLFGNLGNCISSNVGQQQGKFISPDPCKNILCPQVLFQAVRHCMQQLIAHVMAISIINVFQPVQMQVKHGYHL